MVRLSELVEVLGGSCEPDLAASTDREIADVHVDSRRVGGGDLFAALPGRETDGARFASSAIERGAAAVLSPRRIGIDGTRAWLNWVHPAARCVAGKAAAIVHGHPGRSMKVIGITGTNGKSTVAHVARHLLEVCGERPASIGTLEYRLWGAKPRAATHTTPDATELQRLCALNKELGGTALVLEVSSHALDQERIAGLGLHVAVFTNLSRDHLDYHHDMDAYVAAKERIFSHLLPGGTAAIHADDPRGERMAEAARRVGARVVTFGTGSRCDLRASRQEVDLQTTSLFLEGMGIPRTRLNLPLVGRHNVENALAAAAAVLSAGASPTIVSQGLATVTPPPGRLERVDTAGRGFDVFVDYAHTPEALERVLVALREASSARREGGRLICVFGCGGDRDRGKRAPMGEVTARLADVVLVTSDNPRDEDPERIIEDVLEGTRAGGADVTAVTDRRAAIHRALGVARPGDLVLIAGKGHETWQHWRGAKLPFDDRRIVEEELP